ncbi:unnamed protein product [Ectocarpus sp. 4 AP-2014]
MASLLSRAKSGVRSITVRWLLRNAGGHLHLRTFLIFSVRRPCQPTDQQKDVSLNSQYKTISTFSSQQPPPPNKGRVFSLTGQQGQVSGFRGLENGNNKPRLRYHASWGVTLLCYIVSYGIAYARIYISRLPR